MIKVLTVIGTRPEAIKMAPIIRQLVREPNVFRSVVLSTGQHREMLDQVFRLFGITPDRDLQLMQPNQSLARLSGALFEPLDQALTDFRPGWVLAQGDTTTVLVTALVCHYRRVRFGHVEAGLRSRDKWRPFPEETNRRVADLVADAYFAPTEAAAENLRHEGGAPADIFVTGNTVIDALLEVADRPFDWARQQLPQLSSSARVVLVTAHRRESFGEPFRELCEAIRELAVTYGPAGVHFIYPVHLNPNVRQPVTDLLSRLSNVHLLEPVDYFTMVHLMKRSCLILTDSGGVQEEAPSFGVPVLVMRGTTERPEGITAGVAKLVGTSRRRIVEESSAVLAGGSSLIASRSASPYGDGHAAERILQILRSRSA